MTTPLTFWFRRDCNQTPIISLFTHNEIVETHGGAAKWRFGLAIIHFAAQLKNRHTVNPATRQCVGCFTTTDIGNWHRTSALATPLRRRRDCAGYTGSIRTQIRRDHGPKQTQTPVVRTLDTQKQKQANTSISSPLYGKPCATHN